MKKAGLVLVPAPGRGHIVSIIEFAKRLLERDERISITVLVINRPSPPKLDSYIATLAASNPNVRFINLPSVDPPPQELMKSIEKFVAVFIEKHKSLIKDAIINHVLTDPSIVLAGLVIDLFCSSLIDVANEFGVPSYVFFTSSTAFLGFMLHLPVRHSLVGTQFSISDPDSIIPTYSHRVPSKVLPSFVFDGSGGYATMLSHGTRIRETKGFIINTFPALEPHAIKSLESDKELAPAPIYTVGPLINSDVEKLPDTEKIIKWLDDQPSSSVVFLCFGSKGGFELPQIAEMAAALEGSGYRFLWSLRVPPPKKFSINRVEYTDISEILPKGFLERIGNRGLVCGWAPQLEILAHEAVGGYVSHCGWNSVLESLWHGVPIATWPVYAEQQSTAFHLVKELELAVAVTLDYSFKSPDKLVMADEIEKAVRCLMDNENPVRRRVKEIAEKGKQALMDGGSSFISLGCFIEDILVKNL